MNAINLPMLRPGDEPILAGRLAGKRAFVAALEHFPEMAEPSLVLLDFNGVDLATSSYLSEVLLPLRDHLRLRRHPGYAVAANLSDNVREEIEEMLRRSGDAFLTCATDASSDDHRRAALRQARRQASGNASPRQPQTRDHRRAAARGIPRHRHGRRDGMEQSPRIVGGEKPRRGNFAGPHEEVPARSGGCLMGLDFIRATTPTFNRVLDRRLVEMHTPTLFNRDMPIVSRTARADICGDATVAPGEKVLLRVMKDKVIVQRHNVVIAECANAPAEFVAHLRAGAGIARGRNQVRAAHQPNRGDRHLRLIPPPTRTAGHPDAPPSAAALGRRRDAADGARLCRCPDRETCGGIRKKQHAFSCLDDCCGKPDTCDGMCPNNPLGFKERMREVNGLELDNLPRAEPCAAPAAALLHSVHLSRQPPRRAARHPCRRPAAAPLLPP